MQISIAGTGYVGLVTAVCLADVGHNVTCVDVDQNKIHHMRLGIPPIHEPGLAELMQKNRDKLQYTTDYKLAYQQADVIFVAVGTPEKKDGSANLKYVYDVAAQISQSITKDTIVVMKSTVPIGTNDKIEKYMNGLTEGNIKVALVSNPEFLSQGTAVHDTFNTSRIVIGVSTSQSEAVMRELYQDFDRPMVVTDRSSAELIKYASNDFLALKISYINEIANMCEIVGANIDDVAYGMGFDPRIGNKFLQAGIGYGGSCFPKDTKALHWLANYYDYEIKTIKAAIEVNENQKLKLLKKARKYYDNFSNLTVAVLGLTFKPNTDDLREAASLANIPILLEEGAKVKAWDVVGQKNFQTIYPTEITYCETIDEAIEDADICFIFTEWAEVKNYDLSKFAKLMRNPILLDGRNCYELARISEENVIYESVGRNTVGRAVK